MNMATSNTTMVKICGLSDPESLRVAIENGARYLGFVFYPKSPRAITIDTAAMLCRQVPAGVKTVGLFVNPTEEELDYIMGRVSLDMIQLHGTETPEQLIAIKAKYACPIIKAFPISTTADLDAVPTYNESADWFLFDTKSTQTNGTFGGSGHVFDWAILKDKVFAKPWMLAGGLTIENVAKAITLLHPNAVDISSGVERERGVKDPNKIKDFLKTVTQKHSN